MVGVICVVGDCVVGIVFCDICVDVIVYVVCYCEIVGVVVGWVCG